MDINRDKELILEALSHYEGYSPQQRKILQLFIKLAVNDIVVLTPNQIHQMTLVSRPVIYAALDFFKQNGLIAYLEDDNKKVSKYKFTINTTKFIDMVERLKKIKAL